MRTGRARLQSVGMGAGCGDWAAHGKRPLRKCVCGGGTARRQDLPGAAAWA